MAFKTKKKTNEYSREYYSKNRKKLLDYQKEVQKRYSKEKNMPRRLAALIAWRTRREQGWNTTGEILAHFDNRKEINRLNKEIRELEIFER